jgi:hypothetical protein
VTLQRFHSPYLNNDLVLFARRRIQLKSTRSASSRYMYVDGTEVCFEYVLYCADKVRVGKQFSHLTPSQIDHAKSDQENPNQTATSQLATQPEL